jgi:hypothetical protein
MSFPEMLTVKISIKLMMALPEIFSIFPILIRSIYDEPSIRQQYTKAFSQINA